MKFSFHNDIKNKDPYKLRVFIFINSLKLIPHSLAIIIDLIITFASCLLFIPFLYNSSIKAGLLILKFFNFFCNPISVKIILPPQISLIH